MQKQKQNRLTGMYWAEPILPTFGTGEVSQILDIPIWRLQKFLDSKQYQLTPEERVGHGRGSHRRFKIEDIYRLAIASRLVQDGFAAPFIGEMLQQLNDSSFGDNPDSRGVDRPVEVLGFTRGSKGPQLALFPSTDKIRLGEKGSPYYVLDLAELTGAVNARLKKLAEQW